MLTTITVEGKFDHSAIMRNAHKAAVNTRLNNPWMSYKEAFKRCLRNEYIYANALKASMVVVNGQVMCSYDVDTRGD